MAYYTKGMGKTMHNAGSGKMNYAAGMDLTMTNKRNMNMIGRMKSKRTMGGIVIGMMPQVKMGKMMMDKSSQKGMASMLPGMEMTNKRNLSGYSGEGKTMGKYDPMKKMGGRSSRGRMDMDNMY